MLHLQKNPSQNLGNTAYGNAVKIMFVLTTDTGGKLLGGNANTKLTVGTKVALGDLPQGMRLTDSQVKVTDATNATVTAKLGFAYTDGIDNTNVPQDAEYFGTGLVLSAVGRLRNTSTKASHVLPKPALAVLEIAGADVSEASRIEVLIEGTLEG